MRSSPLRVRLSLGIALALAAPSIAAAATFEDKATGFFVQIAPRDAQVCVILPREAPDDASCEGIDVAGLAAALRAKELSVSGFAVLRLPTGNALISVAGTIEQPPQTREQIEGLMRGVRESAGELNFPVQVHGSAPGEPYDIGNVNGIDYLRYYVDLDVPEGHQRYATSRMVTYVFVRKNAIAHLTFSTDPAHAFDVASKAEWIVKTTSMPGVGIEGFGKPRSLFLAGALGKMMGGLMGSIVMIAAIVFVVIKLGYRKKAR